jgi:hypothetical protein
VNAKYLPFKRPTEKGKGNASAGIEFEPKKKLTQTQSEHRRSLSLSHVWVVFEWVGAVCAGRAHCGIQGTQETKRYQRQGGQAGVSDY